eukprot:4583136-Amphidinium_carterae.1
MPAGSIGHNGGGERGRSMRQARASAALMPTMARQVPLRTLNRQWRSERKTATIPEPPQPQPNI